MHFDKYLIQIALVILLFVLQLVSEHYNWYFVNQIDSLEFGTKTATIASFTIVLGILSGIVIVYNFTNNQNNDSKNRKSGMLVGATLLGIISLLVVFLKFLLGAFGPRILPFSLLRPVFRDLYEWTIHSQIPSFWVGFIIGWFVKQ